MKEPVTWLKSGIYLSMKCGAKSEQKSQTELQNMSHPIYKMMKVMPNKIKIFAQTIKKNGSDQSFPDLSEPLFVVIFMSMNP